MPWINFEKDALNYLKKKINDKNVQIDHYGGSDSTENDIKI